MTKYDLMRWSVEAAKPMRFLAGMSVNHEAEHAAIQKGMERETHIQT